MEYVPTSVEDKRLGHVSVNSLKANAACGSGSGSPLRLRHQLANESALIVVTLAWLLRRAICIIKGADCLPRSYFQVWQQQRKARSIYPPMPHL